jgi:hypothetical protein
MNERRLPFNSSFITPHSAFLIHSSSLIPHPFL